MKKYCAKYLPVECKGDDGCKWQWNNNINNTGWEDIAPSDMDAVIAHGLHPQPEFRKLKLFLCSRDIKLGDVYYTDDPNWDNKTLLRHTNVDIEQGTPKMELSYKVIGEISPDATWVKEGDEFDNDELFMIIYYIYGETGSGAHTGWVQNPQSLIGTNIFVGNPVNGVINAINSVAIQIKGPCGYFH